MAEAHAFQAEIQQLLNILIHSLYKEREIFLRELISNASDALNRLQFEMLTTRGVRDADAPLEVHITVDEEAKTLLIADTGIGMTADEMVQSLGVIAHSGARTFLERAKEAGQTGETTLATDIIGQFGVGFYSVFMVADRVEVTSLSYEQDAEAARWASDGEGGYTIEPAHKGTRGTSIMVYLREDAHDFANEWRIREIVRRHSDFVSFPIYVHKANAEHPEEDPQPVNQTKAIWRRPEGEVSDEDYDRYYQALTMDLQPPLLRIPIRTDAPLQFYALLFIPSSAEGSILSPRREPGLKLYARKVLIQEYTTDLLPEYLRFVQGVVDSEDLPLNVSRETVQDDPTIAALRRAITGQVLRELRRLAKRDEETYAQFWEEFGVYLKQGIITEMGDRDRLLPLLRFRSDNHPDTLISLSDYVENFAKAQDTIYYVVAGTPTAAARSPHLDAFREREIDVLYMTDTVDGFMVPALMTYEGHAFQAVDAAGLDLEGVGKKPERHEDDTPTEEARPLVDLMAQVLGEQVSEVRLSTVLGANTPARLVMPEGGLDRHQQRLYDLLEQAYDLPAYILEVNPRHPIVRNLSARHATDPGDPALRQAVDVLYQNALLADGLHPDPGRMAQAIQSLLEQATRPANGDHEEQA